VVRIAVLGAGNRGQKYTEWIRAHQQLATVVAVADPRPVSRARVAAGFDHPREFETWQELMAAIGSGELARPDAVLVTTQDRDHLAPCLAVAEAGLPLLVEKPLGVSAQECTTIVEAVQCADLPFAVGHVMRYTPYTDLVRSVVDSGRLGRIINIQHLEPVGWWHAAHSYVRGNWRRTDESAPMLLAKSSHDIDWIMYVTGRRIDSVASFGDRSHFRASEAPTGSGERCLDCAVETDCPFSAKAIYLEPARRNGTVRWPGSVITDGDSPADVEEALRVGPYGRCVYRSDNDVVDNQVLALRFDDGTAGTFTMTSFSEHTGRRTQIFGTHGTLDGDGEQVEVVEFRSGTREVLRVGDVGGADAAGGHGGGDAGLIAAFVQAVATGDRSVIRSGAEETLRSHLVVFAAEESRRTGTVQQVPHSSELLLASS
jgi:predicted dehydrogenase